MVFSVSTLPSALLSGVVYVTNELDWRALAARTPLSLCRDSQVPCDGFLSEDTPVCSHIWKCVSDEPSRISGADPTLFSLLVLSIDCPPPLLPPLALCRGNQVKCAVFLSEYCFVW